MKKEEVKGAIQEEVRDFCKVCNFVVLKFYMEMQSIKIRQGFPGGSVVKNLPANAGNAGWIPGLERSPGKGNVNPTPVFCLENPMDRGAWRATVHGVEQSPTLLSTHL